MFPTRRLWAMLALVGVFAALSVVFARVELLVAASLVGAWLLTRQYAFARDLQRVAADLSVEQVPARTDLLTDETVPVALSISLERPSSLSLTVEAGLPTAARAIDDLSVSLRPGMRGAERTVDVDWPVTGQHRFAGASVTATDGLFRERLPLGSGGSVTVDSRGPRLVHVGEGGSQLLSAYGDHEGGRRGSGIEPAEIREYVPGDVANRIDWKATARLGTPHVREFEAETERRAILVVDHRHSTAVGPPGESKLEYLREAALAALASTRAHGDPVALLTVADGGITARTDPSAAPATYAAVRRRLLDLEPAPSLDPAAPLEDADDRFSWSRARRRSTPADVHRAFTTLRGEHSPFAATLRPFYADRRAYRERIESDPLYSAVSTAFPTSKGSAWTLVFTDDTRPRELRETVKVARKRGDQVAVFIAPTVLYEPGGLADADRAYERYVVAEELRRDLAGLDRVRAYEVAPTDRLSAVLSSRGGVSP